jgi:hypothetical protein
MKLAIFAMIVQGVLSQPSPSGGGGHDGMGNGIAKSTHACSNASAYTARTFMQKYLPVTTADDDCSNSVCKCGVQSRVETSSDFGIHCTYAAGTNACRANANGGVSVEQIEAIFESKIGDWSTYDSDANVRAWSDYHTSFYYSSLDTLISNLKKDSVAYHSGSWKNATGTYYSVLFHVPNTQMNLEIWSDTCSSCGSYVFEEVRQDVSKLGRLSKSSSSAEFYATQVSRAVEDLKVIIEFYKQTFNLSTTNGAQTLSDGSQYVDFNFGTEVDIRYVRRTKQTGKTTTDWFQNLLVTTNKNYMTGITACWPVWGDNHYAYDGSYKTQTVLDGANSSTFGLYYKPVSAGPAIQAYLLEPSGWQIQLDGIYTAPSGTDGFDPEYCGTSCQNTTWAEFMV